MCAVRSACALRASSEASSALLSLIWLRGQHDEHDADEGQRERADDRVGGEAGAQRRVIAAAILGRDQVDGAHGYSYSPSP